LHSTAGNHHQPQKGTARHPRVSLYEAWLRISGFSAGDFARIRQAISLQSGTLLRRVLGARLDASLLTK
jgi:hypothetical protein